VFIPSFDTVLSKLKNVFKWTRRAFFPCHLQFGPLSQCDMECDGVQKPDLHVLADHLGAGSLNNNRLWPPSWITEPPLMFQNKWHWLLIRNGQITGWD
jgi:hypothetical protein